MGIGLRLEAIRPCLSRIGKGGKCEFSATRTNVAYADEAAARDHARASVPKIETPSLEQKHSALMNYAMRSVLHEMPLPIAILQIKCDGRRGFG